MGHGMNPKFFGNNAWTVYHCINLAFDILHEKNQISPELQNAIKVFNITFPRILQCKVCRDHSTGFDTLLEESKKMKLSQAINSITIASEGCFPRSVLLHNMVNRKLNSPEWSVAQARAHWQVKMHDINRHSQLWYYIVLLVLHFDDNNDLAKGMYYRELFRVFPCLLVLMLPVADVASNTLLVHSCAQLNSNEYPLIELSSATFFKALYPLGQDIQSILHIGGCCVVDIAQSIMATFSAEKNKDSLLDYLSRIQTLLSSVRR